jgi:hypothetical protein
MFLGDASFAVASQMWVLGKLLSGGGCHSLSTGLPVASSFISLRVLGGGLRIGIASGEFSGAIDGLWSLR